MLSQNDFDLVKQTIPLLEGAGVVVTEHFYERMFRMNPELKDVFNLSHQHSGKQALALFNAVAAYAKNIENPSVLMEAVTRIAHKHTSFHIQPHHYDIVGSHLLATLRELAPQEFTPEIEAAWAKAFGVLAGLFIETEASLYSQSESQLGGWQGARKFRLVEKRIESEFVKSLVFEPVDKKPVRDYFPGQYLGIKLSIPNHAHQEIRQYSLSRKPDGKRYQISVKREASGVPGIVSNYLHDGLRLGDVVEIMPPAGDFYFVDRKRPVALISAGVGLTPMTAMLDRLVELEYPQDIYFIHACENAEQHSFAETIASACRAGNIHSHIWYKYVEASEEEGKGGSLINHSAGLNIHEGLIDLTQIEDQLALEQTDFYLCGPVPFMQFAKQQLADLGVTEDRIHYEVFGPHESF